MSEKAKYTAPQIAKWFIKRANSEEIEDGVFEGITNLKLQKIIYFAQAASLGITGKPLFDDEIEAWKYGPVIPSVYHIYKENKNNPIPTPDDVPEFDSDTERLLSDIWDIFGGASASHLVEETHKHKPWKDAYNGGNGEGSVISQDSLRLFYQNVFSIKEG